MFRRLLVASVVGTVGFFAVSGVAAAAPGDTTYPAPPAATTSVPPIVITVTVTVSGGGMLPGEQVSITIIISVPSGLRANSALRAQVLSQAAGGTIVTADANGNFAGAVSFPKGQTGTIVATGLTSGHTESFAVSADGTISGGSGGGAVVTATSNEAPSDGSSVGETTTVANGGTATTSVVAGAPADGSATGGGLASTGASIAGPLTVGVAALLAGLAMLFFGTRLAIRRKSGPSAS